MSSLGEANRQLSDKYNSIPFPREEASIGYLLAQHTTIVQFRQRNKEAFENQDKKDAEWQKNVERHIFKLLKELEDE